MGATACFLLSFSPDVAGAQSDPQTKHYQTVLRPVMVEHCFECHNGGDKKAGLNLEDVYFAISIIRNGATWINVVEQIRSEEMPPHNRPRIPEADKQLLISGIEALLDSALSIPDPGSVVMRRLSNREYRYTVLDLFGVDFNAPEHFPADGSGGEGFDNHSRALYITPLQMERYLQAADTIVNKVATDPVLWKRIAPDTYEPGFLSTKWLEIKGWWQEEDAALAAAQGTAANILYPLATRTYRRFVDQEEKDQLLKIFTAVYGHVRNETDGFNTALKEAIKYLLVSPNFLYRREANVQSDAPFPVTGFELATRLSYFLWSSAPDQTLLDIAYRGDLHNPNVLRAQVERMIQDKKSKRFAESFVGQWLESDKLLEEHTVDPDRFPDYTSSLKTAFREELIVFFHHLITTNRSFLDILDSDYTFLNDELAAHYGLPQVGSDSLTLTHLDDARRGGVLGMGSVLTVTSFPTRTSPVLRGKWVLEQLLGTPPPPPPPDVPELSEIAESHIDELDLRAILEKHREPSACFGCHQKMDPIGLGLENFDAVGAWRTTYSQEQPIDASGVLPNGTTFEGPAALRQILLSKKDAFAKNLSKKMLGYALGRTIRFKDQKTLQALRNNLIENNFDTTEFLFGVANSFPFRYKKSDTITREQAP